MFNEHRNGKINPRKDSASLAIFAAIRHAATALKAEQQLRQFRHIDCNPSRLVFGEQFGG